MSADDDVSQRILEGDAYEEAVVTVRQTFPVGLDRKVHIAVGTLATAGVVAPALFLTRGYVAAVTGADSLSATLSPSVMTLGLAGVVVTFGAGVVLVRQQYVVRHGSPSEERARRLVRLEDMVMWFVVQGAAFIAIPTTVSVLTVVSTAAVDSLYDSGINAFGPAGATGIDARLVSGLGVVLATVLYAASARVRGAL